MTVRSDEPRALDPDAVPAAPSEQKMAKPTPWLRYGVIVACVVVGVVWLGHWLLVDRYRITTDDAYVDTDQVMVMSRVSERVARVLVDTNQPVRRGQVLVELEEDLLRAQDRGGQTCRHRHERASRRRARVDFARARAGRDGARERGSRRRRDTGRAR